jgi:hypothetical protein
MNGLFAHDRRDIGLTVLAGEGGAVSVSRHALDTDAGDLAGSVEAEQKAGRVASRAQRYPSIGRRISRPIPDTSRRGSAARRLTQNECVA